MKHVLAVTIVSVLFVTAGVAVIDACGAKFLVAARSARLQKMQRVAKPARILIYQHSDDPQQDPAALEDFVTGFGELLEKVGHTVAIAATEDALREAIRSSDFDVVVVQLDTARRLHADLNSWAPRTVVLPLGEALTRGQAAQAKEEFGHILKYPAMQTEYLSTVQESYRRN